MLFRAFDTDHSAADFEAASVVDGYGLALGCAPDGAALRALLPVDDLT